MLNALTVLISMNFKREIGIHWKIYMNAVFEYLTLYCVANDNTEQGKSNEQLNWNYYVALNSDAQMLVSAEFIEGNKSELCYILKL